MHEAEKVNRLFDDLDLLSTELSVPHAEIIPITNDNVKLITHTNVPADEIYVNYEDNGFRLSYFDFASYIRDRLMRYI